MDQPSTITDPERIARDGLVTGLRALADLIDSGTVPIPTTGLKPSFFVHDEQPKAATRALMRALGVARWDKDEWDDQLIMRGRLHGLPVDIWVSREAVCERVVTGTRVVTETVPVGEDPRPVETVNRTEEIVEWVCSPLLADSTPAS